MPNDYYSIKFSDNTYTKDVSISSIQSESEIDNQISIFTSEQQEAISQLSEAQNPDEAEQNADSETIDNIQSAISSATNLYSVATTNYQSALGNLQSASSQVSALASQLASTPQTKTQTTTVNGKEQTTEISNPDYQTIYNQYMQALASQKEAQDEVSNAQEIMQEASQNVEELSSQLEEIEENLGDEEDENSEISDLKQSIADYKSEIESLKKQKESIEAEAKTEENQVEKDRKIAKDNFGSEVGIDENNNFIFSQYDENGQLAQYQLGNYVQGSEITIDDDGNVALVNSNEATGYETTLSSVEGVNEVNALNDTKITQNQQDKISQTQEISEETIQNAILDDIETQLTKEAQDIEANANSKTGLGALWNGITGIFGGGTNGQLSDNSELEAALKELRNNPDSTQIAQLYQEVFNKEVDTEAIKESIVVQNQFDNGGITLSDGKTVSMKDVAHRLMVQSQSLTGTFKDTVDNQGIVTGIIGGINNFVGIGTTQNMTEAQIEQYQQQVNKLSEAKTSEEFAAIYQSITGEELSASSIEELFSGEDKTTNSKAVESMSDYESTNSTIKNTAIAVGVGIATAATGGVAGAVLLGAAATVGVNALDAATQDNCTNIAGNLASYATHDMVKDALVGGLNGLTGKLGNIAGEKLVSTFATDAAKTAATEAGELAVKQATAKAAQEGITLGEKAVAQVAKNAANSALKSSLNAAQRITSEFVDGALDANLSSIGEYLINSAAGENGNFTNEEGEIDIAGNFNKNFNAEEMGQQVLMSTLMGGAMSVGMQEGMAFIGGALKGKGENADVDNVKAETDVDSSGVKAETDVDSSGVKPETDVDTDANLDTTNAPEAKTEITNPYQNLSNQEKIDALKKLQPDATEEEIQEFINEASVERFNNYYLLSQNEKAINALQNNDNIEGLIVNVLDKSEDECKQILQAFDDCNYDLATCYKKYFSLDESTDDIVEKLVAKGTSNSGISNILSNIKNPDGTISTNAINFANSALDKGVDEWSLGTILATKVKNADGSLSDSALAFANEVFEKGMSIYDLADVLEGAKDLSGNISDDYFKSVDLSSYGIGLDNSTTGGKIDTDVDTSGVKADTDVDTEVETVKINKLNSTDSSSSVTTPFEQAKQMAFTGDYSNTKEFSEYLAKKIDVSLGAKTPDEISQSISKIAQETGASQAQVTEVMSRLSQFSSYSQLSTITDELDGYRLANTYGENQLSIQTCMEYLTKKKGQMNFHGVKEITFAGVDDLAKMQNMSANELENFIGSLANSQGKIAILDGSILSFSDGTYATSSLFGSSMDLDDLTAKVINEMNTTGRTLDDICGGDLIKDIQAKSNGKINFISVTNPNSANATATTIAEQLAPIKPSSAEIEEIIDSWVDEVQIDSSQKEVAKSALAKYLDFNATQYSSESITQEMLSKYSSIKEIVETQGKTMDDVVYIMPSSKGDVKSFQLLSYQYSQITGEDASKFVQWDESWSYTLPKKYQGKTLVMLDDIVGSGSSMLSGQTFKYSMVKNQADVIFAPLSCLSSGKRNIATKILDTYSLPSNQVELDNLLSSAKDKIIPSTVVTADEFINSLSIEEQNALNKALGGFGYSQGKACTATPYMIPDNDSGFSFLYSMFFLNNPLSTKIQNKNFTNYTANSTINLYKKIKKIT